MENPADRASEPPPLPAASAAAGGLVSILVQSVVLRESLFGQHLSELASGMVLAAWLLASGLGAAMAGRARAGRRAWSLSLLLLPATGFLQVILTRFSLLHPALAAVPAGLAAGVVFLAPFAGRPAGRVYALEAVGAAAGGLLFLLLSPGLLAPGILLAASVASATGLLLCTASWRWILGALLPAAALLGGLDGLAARWLAGAAIGEIGTFTLHPSPYGELALVHRSGQTAVLRNGILEASWPALEAAERAVTVPLLASLPERVVQIGASPEEAWRIASWPGVRRITTVIPDRTLLRLVEYPAGVRIGDARRVLSGDEAWEADLILVPEGQPLSLLANRYYSREFFTAAAGRLGDQGMLAVGLPGGIQRLHPLEARMALSVRLAAAEVFDWTLLLPSGGLLLLAGFGDAPELDGEILARRMDSLGAGGVCVHSGTLPTDLSRQRIEALGDQLAGEEASANRDLHPEAFRCAQELWILRSGEDISPGYELGIVLTCLLVGVAASLRSGRPGAAAPLAAAGAAGLAVEMLAIVMIQASTGHSWTLVGLVTGGFMAGAAAGAVLQLHGHLRSWRSVLLFSVSGSGVAALGAASYDASVIGGGLLTPVLLLGVWLAGMGSGSAFPMAASSLPTGGGRVPGLGLLDLAEHAAAAAAAVAVPLLLFPLMGAGVSLLSVLGLVLLAAALSR